MKSSSPTVKSSNEMISGSGDLLARIISDAANPLVLPSLVIVIVSLMPPLPVADMMMGIGTALVFYSAIPFLAALWMLKKGLIGSLDIPVHHERTPLFRYGILSTALGSLLLLAYFQDLQHPVSQAAVVFLANSLAAYLLNRSFKISIHTGTVATAGAFFLGLYLFGLASFNVWAGIFSLMFLLILLPAMVWSRLRLGVHTVPEIVGGGLAGLLFTLLEIGILQLIG